MSRTTFLTALALLCSSSISPSLFAAPSAELPPGSRVGLYPLQLPEGPRAVNDRLSAQLGAQLKDGVSGLARIGEVKLVARGACLSDEGGCLAAEARSANLSGMVSGRVVQSERGFAFELRLFAAKDGSELALQRGSVEGGPLDLASGLEHGLCELLSGTPCVGSLSVRGDRDSMTSGTSDPMLYIDGKEAGPLSAASQLALPVGRHLIRVGKSEKRVRVAYHRETKMVCAESDGAISLELAPGEGEPVEAVAAATDDAAVANPAAPIRSAAELHAPGAAIPAALIPASATADAPITPQTRAGRLMLAAGGALLMTATGIELYARAQSAALDSRYENGQLTSADASSYGKVHTAGVAALLLGATGVGALAVGGVVLLLSPDGAAVQGKF